LISCECGDPMRLGMTRVCVMVMVICCMDFDEVRRGESSTSCTRSLHEADGGWCGCLMTQERKVVIL
jgi:hypothetical protein